MVVPAEPQMVYMETAVPVALVVLLPTQVVLSQWLAVMAVQAQMVRVVEAVVRVEMVVQLVAHVPAVLPVVMVVMAA